ncbi:MAG TPA: hypothetical protein PK637_06855 [Flavobacteriales bacterium]|nr:hypothetical protein [Flavobacteriales bacterium]HRJ35233.1 hypothetical protein [Flavobacteriales bacterium]HRJ39341.1 hypothetical protein [Flavobacteriales bacterium]
MSEALILENFTGLPSLLNNAKATGSSAKARSGFVPDNNRIVQTISVRIIMNLFSKIPILCPQGSIQCIFAE